MYTHNLSSEFSFSMHGDKVTIQKQRSDFDIHELLDIMRSLALASGWNERVWEDGILELAAIIEEERGFDKKEDREEYPDFPMETSCI